MGNKNSSDHIISPNTLDGYQRWDFKFSGLVDLEDVTITDIDSSSRSYIDAVIAEGFTTSNPGNIGTGIAPSYTNLGSRLTTSSVNLPGGGSIDSVTDDVVGNGGYQGNPTSAVTNHADVTFAEPVDSFSLYLFNNEVNSSTGEHGVGIGGEGFQITVNEVPFEFSPSLGLLLSGASLFGVNYLRKKKVLSQ